MQIDQVFVIDEDADAAMQAGMQQQMEAGGSGDASGRMLGLIKTADGLAMQGKADEAMAQYSEALGIANEMKWDKAIAAAGNVLTKIYIQQAGPHGDEDDLQAALESAEDTLQKMKKAGYKKGEAVALGTYATVYFVMGKTDKGIDCGKDAAKIFQAASDYKGMAAMFMLLKDGFLLKGNAYKAAALAKKAASIYDQLGDKRMEGKCQLKLAKVEIAGGDQAKATAACKAAKTLFMAAGDTAGMGESYDVLIGMQKEGFEAVKLAKERTSTYHEAGDMSGEAYSLLKLGELLMDNGENVKADKVAEVALGMFAGMNDMGGMKAGKELMDKAKDAKLVQDIHTTLGDAEEYMHIPPSLIIQPGLTYTINEKFTAAVSGWYGY
jgi:tetratricopeptide (TPR) repeat protein